MGVDIGIEQRESGIAASGGATGGTLGGMTDVRAVIDGAGVSPAMLMQPMLGVPLVLWSYGALRRVMPGSAIAIRSEDAGIVGVASSRGLYALGPRSTPDAMVVDPMRPFATQATVQGALDQGASALAAVQRSPIESIHIADEATFALARAVAIGLAPDDAHVVGIRRMRLPLSVDVKAVVSDVDGVLTDGGITYGDGAHAQRRFSTHDGMGTKLLLEAGIKVGWLSATTSGASIEKRAKQIGVEFVDAGAGDKGPRFERMCEQIGVQMGEVLYVGDDVNDLPAMMRAGLSACPADGCAQIRSRVDLVLEARGGFGAFREAADLILDGLAVT